MQTYVGEFRANGRYLAAAGIGLGCGHTLNHYLLSIFAPRLVRDLGWSKSQFALLGATILVVVICTPIVGRLTDVFGVRRIATVGVISSPLIFVAFGSFNGDFLYFFLISVAQVALVSTTTTMPTYGRLIAEQFDQARGLAFAFANCIPVMAAAMILPGLSGFIDVHGWRTAYFAVAIGVAVAGAVALLLIPVGSPPRLQTTAVLGRSAKHDYQSILRDPIFHFFASAMFLCNIPVLALVPNLKLALLDKGTPSATATFMISFFAISNVIGRLSCGLALDRFPTHIVAAMGFGLTSVGLLILGSNFNALIFLDVASVLLGLSIGAQLAITGYLIMHFFRLDVYSTVYGLVAVIIAVSGTLGSGLLSFMLKSTGGFTQFFFLGGILTLAGSALFALLGRYPGPSLADGPSAPEIPSEDTNRCRVQ
jgi:MFS family permease